MTPTVEDRRFGAKPLMWPSTTISLWPFSSSRASRVLSVVPYEVLFVTVLSGNEANYILCWASQFEESLSIV